MDETLPHTARAVATTHPTLHLTENQTKVIKDKYLRDAPSPEAWLEGVASNIALGELLHLGKDNKIFAGVDVLRQDIDVGGGHSTLSLLHHNKHRSRERQKNFMTFMENLKALVVEDPEAAAVHHKAKERFYNVMANFEFLPNSPTLMNAGRPLQQLSACYVLPIDDSIEGWMDAVKHAAIIHQSGGGTGFSACRVRPRGSPVKGSRGVASGALSPFMLIDAMTAEVKQGGTRRGANMGILPYNHSDILEFIEAKRKPGVLENFNISVAITEEFMEKVEKGEDYELIDVHTNKPSGTLNAKEMWDTLVASAWETGDPGLIMIDRINKTDSNPTPHLGQIESTNPCVTGDTFVSTEHGLLRMKELVEQYGDGGIAIATDSRVPLRVKSGDGFVLMDQATKGVTFNRISQAFSSGIKDVYLLRTKNGCELKLTEDHKVITREGFIKVKDLSEKDEILLQKGEGKFGKKEINFNVTRTFVGKNGRTYHYNFPQVWSQELGQVLGWLVGDGWLRKGGKHCRVGFTFGKDDKEVLHYLKPILNSYYGQDIQEIERENGVYHLSYHSKYFVDFFEMLGVKACKADDKVVPEKLFTASKDAVIGFLQGLFSADGTVRDSPKSASQWIALTSKSKELLLGVQVLLFNLGIKSTIFNRSRKPRLSLFNYVNKKGETKTYGSDGVLYELGIFAESLQKFRDTINFMCEHKISRLNRIIIKKTREQKFFEKITSIEHVGQEEVYDLTEPFTHSMICNCIVTTQCGEQPLLPFEPCNLGSINLSKFVADDGSDMNWERLKTCVHTCTRFLDNVIDVNNYPLAEIEVLSKSNRRIGLGVMGWAEALVMLGLPYNSQKAFDKAEHVMQFINDETLAASEELAKTRGVFPNWKDSIFDAKGPHFRGQERRPRHCARTTIAPTGTIGITAGLQGAGIEPFFAVVYTRYNAKAIDALKNGEKPEESDVFYEINPLFKKIAEKHDHFGMTPDVLWDKIEQNHKSLKGIAEIPVDVQDLFLTSHDLTPEDHVHMQAAFQKHTNNAVSKTINFTNDATIEDVQHAYTLAFSLGCKGITIYRDGSKDTQVLNLKPSTTNKKAPEQPEKKEMSKQEIMQSGICPECSNVLKVGEGCYTCMSCGFSACSV